MINRVTNPLSWFEGPLAGPGWRQTALMTLFCWMAFTAWLVNERWDVLIGDAEVALAVGGLVRCSLFRLPFPYSRCAPFT